VAFAVVGLPVLAGHLFRRRTLASKQVGTPRDSA
jgi:hypothetical protein